MTQAQAFPMLAAIVAAGYLALKRRRPREIVEQTLKTVIGCHLITMGAEVSVRALSGLGTMLNAEFGVRGGVLNTEVFGAILAKEHGGAGFAAFLLAFLVNVLMARYARRGRLFLTGHHLFFLSLVTVSILRLGTALSGVWCVVIGGILTGLYAFAAVSVSASCMSGLKKNTDVGLANSVIGAALIGMVVGRLSRKKGEKAKSAVDTGIGADVGINANYFTTLGVGTVFCLHLLLHATDGMRPGGDALFDSIELALLYGVAMTMLLLGIRMFLAVFIQLFWDVGRKLVPHPSIGLDASAIISYSPRAWRSGFIAASVTGTAAALLLLAARAPFIPLPGLTSFYFAGGVAGVFGELHGGKRSAHIAGGVAGAAVILFIALYMGMSGAAAGGTNLDGGAALGETDYGIWGSLLTFLIRLFA